MKDRTKLARLCGMAFALALTAACAGEEEVEIDVEDAPPAATMPPPAVGPAPADSMALDTMDSVPR